MKFETENSNQTPETKLSPESEKSNMANRRPFWKWRQCKSIDFYPYSQRLCYWTLELIFKAKLKVESGNQKILNGHKAAILKVTSLKINRLLPIATINMCMKFEIEIPQQTWLMLRKLCRLQTDGWTDRQTDEVNPVYPPYNFNACRRCSYYISILDFTPCFNRLHKDNYKTRRETFQFWDLVHLISRLNEWLISTVFWGQLTSGSM